MLALPETFSYAEAAKELSSGSVKIAAKITTCETLLEKTSELYPHPAPLLVQHAIYALQSDKSDFDPFHHHYWQILTHTLQIAKKDGISVPSLPHNLFSCAARHLKKQLPTKNLTKAIAGTLSSILESKQHSQSLATYSTLLTTVSAVVLNHPHLDNFYVRLLHVYRSAQLREPDPRKCFALAIPLLESSFANGPNIHPSVARIFSYAFFQDLNISKQPLYQFLLGTNSVNLPYIVEFLVRSSVNHGFAETKSKSHYKSMENLRKRESSMKNDHKANSHILSLFIGVLNALELRLKKVLGDEATDAAALNEEDSIPKQKRLNLMVNDKTTIKAISSLLQIGSELRISSYELEFLVQSRPKKKIRLQNKDDEENSLAKYIQRLNTTLVRLLKTLNSQKDTMVEDSSIVSNAIKSIISFSLDPIEKDTGAILEAWVTWREEEEILDFVIPSRRELICTLIEEYSKRRDLERFIHNFCSTSYGNSLFRLYNVLFKDQVVQRKLAGVIVDLPQQGWRACLETLKSTTDGQNNDNLPWVAFLISIIVETNNETEKSQVLDVLKDVLSTVQETDSADLRCSMLFLFASTLFMTVRGKVDVNNPAFQRIIQSGVFAKCCNQFNQDPRSRDPSKFHIALIHSLSQTRNFDDAEMYCSIRVLCALLHFLVLDSNQSEDNTAIRETLITALRGSVHSFTQFSERGPNVKGKFYSHELRDITVMIGSVSDLFEFFNDDEEFIKELQLFLSWAVNHYSINYKIWDNMLEKKSVRNAIPEAVLVALQRYRNKIEAGTNESCDPVCELQSLLGFLQNTSNSYLSSSNSITLRNKQCLEGITENLQYMLKVNCCNSSKKALWQSIKQISNQLSTSFKLDAIEQGWSENTLQGLVQPSHDEPVEARIGFIEALFNHWSSKSPNVERQLDNYIIMLRNVNLALKTCDFKSIEQSQIVIFFAESFPQIQEIGDQFLKEKDWGHYPNLSELLVNILALYETLNNLISAESDQNNNQLKEISTSCKQFLCSNISLSVERALTALSLPNEKEWECGSRTAATNFLRKLCSGKPAIYTLILSRDGCCTLISILAAKSIMFLNDSNNTTRFAGAVMISRFSVAESTESIDQIGQLILKRLNSNTWKVAELRQYLREDNWQKIPINLVERLEKLRGSILGAACMLCGGSSEDDTGLVTLEQMEGKENDGIVELADVRTRGDLTGQGLNRNLIEKLTISLLEGATEAVFLMKQMNNLNERVQDENVKMISYAKRIINECGRYAMQGCETAMERKTPFRLSNEITQMVLIHLRNIVDVWNNAESIDRICDICQRCISLHGVVGKWAIGRLLCGISKVIAKSECIENVQSWRAAIECLCGKRGVSGRIEIMKCIIADCCQAMTQVNRKQIRMEMLSACALAIGAIGDDNVKLIMVVVSDSAKSILREARELYTQELQYIGR